MKESLRKRTRENEGIFTETYEREWRREFGFACNLSFESQTSPPTKTNIEVNEFVIPTGVNTGASTSLLNWDTFQKINVSSQFVLLPTKCKLQTYSGEIALPKRVVEVEFA